MLSDLAAFFEQKRGSACPVYATFLLSGEVKQSSDKMDVDGDVTDALRQKMILVGEENLGSEQRILASDHSTDNR